MECKSRAVSVHGNDIPALPLLQDLDKLETCLRQLTLVGLREVALNSA
jgi:hypothetical protein